MYWENQPELPSDKGSNQSWGVVRDIGRGPFIGLLRSLKYNLICPCLKKMYMSVI